MKLFQKSSLVSKWTRSFLIVLIIPIIFNYISYQYLMRNIRQELNYKNNIFYQNVQRQIDLELDRYSKIASELASNPDLLSLRTIQTIDQASPEMIRAFQDALKSYYFTLYNAYKFYFYFSGSSTVGSAEGLQNDMKFFTSAYSGLDIDYDTWREWVSSPYTGIQVVKGTGSLTDVSSKYIMFKYRLTSDNTFMIIMIRDAYFTYQMGKMVADSKINYEIFDRSGTLLATSLPSDTMSQGVTDYFTEAQGMFEFDLNGEKTIANYIAALDTGWRFVFYTPKTHYYAPSNGFYVMALLMFIAIVLGMAIIRFLVSRQYSPIKKFLANVPSNYTDKDQNEYAQMEGLILEAAQQLRQTKTLQEKHTRQMKDMFWVKLLNGTLSDFQEETVKKYLSPEFSSPPNAVILFPMHHYGDLFQDENISDFERYNLLVDIIDNIGRELLEAKGMESYFFESYSNCIALISAPSEKVFAQLDEVLSEFLTLMKLHFNVELCAGVSEWHEDIFELTKAYTEAFSCIDYIQFTEESDIVFYGDIAVEHTAPLFPMVDKINQLCNYIKYGESAKACDFVDDLIYQFTHSVSFEPIVFKYYIHDLINTITKNFQNYVNSDNKKVNDIYLLTLTNSTDIRSIQSGIHDLIQSICAKINRETEAAEDTGSAALAKKIKSYIDEHYTDADLSANMVAQEFHISSPYISKIFKTIQPEGFVNYINNKRIEKAKELLRCTSKKIDEVSHETGFLNTTSFIRLFKKIVGTTPGTYRKSQT